MLLFLIFIFFDLNEILKGFEENLYFVSKFIQRYEVSPNNVIEESGEVIFNFKKGIKFNYTGNEKKSFIINEDGFYSKEGEGEWNFTQWDVESEEYKFFVLLINGKIEEKNGIIVEKKKKEYIISSEKPNFKIILDKKNFYPLKFFIKLKNGSLNYFEFKNHKRIYKEIKI